MCSNLQPFLDEPCNVHYMFFTNRESTSFFPEDFMFHCLEGWKVPFLVTINSYACIYDLQFFVEKQNEENLIFFFRKFRNCENMS